ncbi:hypothetical protein BDA99DRAFT_562542 [Phascolomyces articulosus]|uniref:Retrotransposon gag domain-containing protein n=1 Tax=Phascolomyces articulosus TaxID=60185 RepID=A0AAD5K3K3_9FUNG|nr:hypothetical protein BDA99DRAFT_562542 [Phascolomyces articulosus]
MEEAQSDAETASVSSHSQASNCTVDSKKSNQSRTAAHSSAITPGSIFSEYANPKAMMENIIHHYKVKLERLIKQYNRVLSSASPEMLKERQQDIINTQKTLCAFHTSYYQEYSPESQTKSKAGNKNTDRMTAKDVPLFQVTGITIKDNNKEVFKSVDHFLRRFKKIVEANTSDKIDKQWSKWLPLAFPYDLDHWYDQKLAKNDKYSWSKVCKVMKKRFQSVDLCMEKATEAYTITMNKGETVADYGTHFLNTCRDGGVKDEPGLAL